MPLKSRLPLALFLATIALIANGVSEWPSTIRFMYSPLDGLTLALLVMSLPFSLAFLVRTFTARLVRSLTFVAVALLSIPALLFSGFAALNPVAMELQDSLSLGSATYRIYMQEPGFASAPPFTILRKEIDTPFGIKFVHSIWKNERIGNARIQSVNSSTLEAVIAIDDYFFRERIEI